MGQVRFLSVFMGVLLYRQTSACYLKLAVQHHLRLNFEVKHQFLYFPLDQVGMRLFIEEHFEGQCLSKCPPNPLELRSIGFYQNGSVFS